MLHDGPQRDVCRQLHVHADELCNTLLGLPQTIQSSGKTLTVYYLMAPYQGIYTADLEDKRVEAGIYCMFI